MTVYRRPDPIPLPQNTYTDKARIAPVRSEVEDLNHLAARQIFLAIVSKTWGATGFLPKEDELGRDLCVSRTVLREAVKTLASKSVVETRRRRGTAILDHTQWNLMDSQILAWLPGTVFLPDLAASLLDLLSKIQPELTHQCAKDNAFRAETASALLQQAKQSDAVLRFKGFHLTLAERSNNPFVVSIVSKTVGSLCSDHAQSVREIAASTIQYTRICTQIGQGQAEAAASSVRKLLQPEKVLEMA